MPLSVRPLRRSRFKFLLLDLLHTSTRSGMWRINIPKEDFIIFSPTLEKISDQKKTENVAVLIKHFLLNT